MIAFSSHRPHTEHCAEEIKRNQIAAHKTWEVCFEKIIYLGDREEDLCGPNTQFVQSEPFPSIAAIATLCSSNRGWSCMINADIVLKPYVFSAVELQLLKNQARSASSFRFEFDPEDPKRTIRLYDMGLDIYCAVNDVWRGIEREVPSHYRIGHDNFDRWIYGYFETKGQPTYDFTGSRCVLHPMHGNRQRPFTVEDVFCVYRMNARPPRRKISIRDVLDSKKNAARSIV